MAINAIFQNSRRTVLPDDGSAVLLWDVEARTILKDKK